MTVPFPDSHFDDLVAEMEAEYPELMAEATAQVKALLSTEDGKARLMRMFVPIELVTQRT